MKIRFAAKLILTYVVSFGLLCILFGVFNNTPYDMTTLTWWLRKPLALLSFVPVLYLIERRVRNYAVRRGN